MPTLTAITRWIDAHALSLPLYLALATGLLRAAYALASRILAPYPRARAAVEACAALAPDVLRFMQQVFLLLTGRPMPSTQPVSVVPAPPADDTPADGDRHASIVPPPPSPLRAVTIRHRPPPAPDGQRGSASVRALIVFVVALTVVLPLGAALTGCPNWQRPVCPAPGVYACVADQPAVCSPSGEQTPIGDEPCSAQGRVCVLRADGVAYCARSTDGGAL